MGKKTSAAKGRGSLAIYLALAGVYSAGLLGLGFFGDRGYWRGYQIYQETQRAQLEIDRLTLENQRLAAVLRDLDTNPRLLERKAREDLGLARRDELVYLFIPKQHRGR